MTPDKRLRELLRLRGIASDSAGPTAAWEAFKQFGRENFETPGVGLLFEVGDFGRWWLSLVCQFEVLDAEGEHAHYEQTHCEMKTDVTPDLKGVKRHIWSFEFASADAFFTAVETLPEFRLALSCPSYDLKVYHDQV